MLGKAQPPGAGAAHPRRSCHGLAERPCVAAIGAFALAQLLGGGGRVALACNTDNSPSPPSVANIDVSGKTYTPQSPLNDGQAGEPGCDGGPGGARQSGGPGLPGVPGPSFSATYDDVAVQGVVSSLSPFVAAVTASGGTGGRGGDSGSVDSQAVNAGNGAGGGNGGKAP